MKTGQGPYMQQAGRGNGPQTGGGPRMQPLMYNGPLLPDPTDPIGKQSTEPKVVTERYRGTNEQGQSGMFTKSTTTIPGSGGGSGSGTIKRTPEGDAAYAALTPAQRAAQDAKWNAMQAGTPDQTNTQIRFNPDATPLTTKPVRITPSTMPKAPGITPLARPLPTVQAQRGTADDPVNTQRGLSGTRSSGGSSSMNTRTVSPKNLQTVISGIQNVASQVAEKYNPDNVPSRVQGMGQEAVEKWKQKVVSRRDNLTPTVRVNK